MVASATHVADVDDALVPETTRQGDVPLCRPRVLEIGGGRDDVADAARGRRLAGGGIAQARIGQRDVVDDWRRREGILLEDADQRLVVIDAECAVKHMASAAIWRP